MAISEVIYYRTSNGRVFESIKDAEEAKFVCTIEQEFTSSGRYYTGVEWGSFLDWLLENYTLSKKESS